MGKSLLPRHNYAIIGLYLLLHAFVGNSYKMPKKRINIVYCLSRKPNFSSWRLSPSISRNAKAMGKTVPDSQNLV